jgi:monoamine oxidase
MVTTRKTYVQARDITRRGLLSAAAASAAGAAIAQPARAAERAEDSPQRRRGPSKRADVVVVGAGPAGLIAANRIAAAGRSVIVVEARDRVGGRIKNWHCGMPPACDCGQLIAPHHKKTRALLKKLGLGLYPQHAVATGTGNDVVYVGGQRFETPAGGPLGTRALAPITADAGIELGELDSMAATISPRAPWDAQRAAEWDAQTVETWKQHNALSPSARFIIDFLVFVAGACDSSDVSLLHLLTYLSRLGDGKHGTAEVLDFIFLGDYVHGGLQEMPNRLAKRLGGRNRLVQPERAAGDRCHGSRAQRADRFRTWPAGPPGSAD